MQRAIRHLMYIIIPTTIGIFILKEVLERQYEIQFRPAANYIAYSLVTVIWIWVLILQHQKGIRHKILTVIHIVIFMFLFISFFLANDEGQYADYAVVGLPQDELLSENPPGAMAMDKINIFLRKPHIWTTEEIRTKLLHEYSLECDVKFNSDGTYRCMPEDNKGYAFTVYCINPHDFDRVITDLLDEYIFWKGRNELDKYFTEDTDVQFRESELGGETYAGKTYPVKHVRMSISIHDLDEVDSACDGLYRFIASEFDNPMWENHEWYGMSYTINITRYYGRSIPIGNDYVYGEGTKWQDMYTREKMANLRKTWTDEIISQKRAE